MDIAVFGGSFDPPHMGHAMVVAWLRWVDPDRQVWIVPSFGHPFGKDLSPFPDRIRWCEALRDAVGPGGIFVSGIEQTLPTPTYTIDTLRAIRDLVGSAHRIQLVVGSDILRETAKWKAWDEIEREFDPIVIYREGYWNPKAGTGPNHPSVPMFPSLSSTDIRGRLAAGGFVGGLVPKAVLDILPGQRFWAR